MYLDLHITKKCNLNCKHCYLSDKEKIDGKNMDFNILSNIVSDYISIQPPFPSPKKIVLSGGEPTLHPEIEKILNFINKKHEGRLIIPSNGYGVSKLLKTGAILDRNRVQISIDGNKEIHNKIRGEGSFTTAINALEDLVKTGKKTHIFFTINKFNESSFPEVKRIANDLGVKVFLNYYHNIDLQKDNLGMLTKEEFKKYLKANNNVKKCYLNNCVAGILGCTVMPNGDYYDCSRNMNYMGEYPQKLKDVLFLTRATNKQYRSPANTCMKSKFDSCDKRCGLGFKGD